MRPRLVGVAVLGVVAVWGMAGCRPVAQAAGAGDGGSGVGRAWPYPVVWVEDHTGPSWPVTTAVRQWNTGTDQSIRYGHCRTHAGCIRMVERDEGDNGDNGETTTRRSGRSMVTATVTLNDYYASDGPEIRLATTCHEIGLGLGLPHNPSRGSCLYKFADLATHAAPDTRDRAALNTAWRGLRAATAGRSR